jgi:hypothetical protein
MGWIEKTLGRVMPKGAEPFNGDESQAAAALLVERAVRDLCWGDMTYRCDDCGFDWKVGLALGVEGPASLRSLDLYVPAPFMFKCPAWTKGDFDATELPPGTPNVKPCGGHMGHTDWINDSVFAVPSLLADDVPRFLLPDSGLGSARLLLTEGALIRARRSSE